jgi:hypothetical protein
VLDRDDLLHAANPALGLPDRLQLDFIRDTERRALPPREFMRERFGWWDDPAATVAALPPGTWEACADPGSTIAGRTALAVAMTQDRATVSVVAAGRRADGHVHVETVRHGRAGAWIVPTVVDIATRQGADVVIHPGHPVGSLLADLQAAKVRLRLVTTVDYTQACGRFYDAVIGRRLHYPPPQPELSAAVANATRKLSGDAWRWSGTDISALVAATQAAHAAAPVAGAGKGRAIALR